MENIYYIRIYLYQLYIMIYYTYKCVINDLYIMSMINYHMYMINTLLLIPRYWNHVNPCYWTALGAFFSYW